MKTTQVNGAQQSLTFQSKSRQILFSKKCVSFGGVKQLHLGVDYPRFARGQG
jgi:hypothetical protein